MSELVYKFLDDTQKQHLIDQCLEALNGAEINSEQSASARSVLKSILVMDDVFCKYKNDLLVKLEGYCYEVLEHKDLHSIDVIIQFTDIAENIKVNMFNLVHNKLMSFLSSTTLIPTEIANLDDFKIFIKSYESQNDVIVSKDDIVFYLNFLIKLNYRKPDDNLNKLICFSLTLHDSEVPVILYKIINFDNLVKDNNLKEIIWTVIFELTLHRSMFINNEKIGYKLWINYLYMMNKNNIQYDFFFKLIESNEAYWLILQRMLVSNNYEFRKYAISIVQLTFQNIPRDMKFKNGKIMNWDLEFEKDWNRYFTIYEITGIDTSLHQVQEGLKDLNLLRNIPESWLLTLLSTSIKASMDSVRKFTLEFIFGMTDDQLSIFNDSIEFLNIFFDFTMQANLFNVNKNNECIHGEELSTFVQRLIRKMINGGEFKLVKDICDLIFEKLHSSSFEFSKVYLAVGLNNGLNKNLLDETSLLKLEQLFTIDAENEISKISLTRIYFKLLMKADPKKVHLKTLLNFITKFVQVNGYHCVSEESECLLDFISIYYSKDQLLSILSNSMSGNNSLESYVITLFLVYKFNNDAKSLEVEILKRDNFPKIMVEVVKSQLDLNSLIIQMRTYYLKLIEELSNNLIKDSYIWEYSQSLITYPIFYDDDENIFNTYINFKKLNVVLNVELRSNDSKVLELCIYKLRFFAKCYSKTKYLFDLSFDDILKLNDSISRNIDIIEYKKRDLCYQSLFQIIFEYFQVNLPTSELLRSLFKLIIKNFKYILYYSQLEVLKVLKYLLSNSLSEISKDDILEIVDIISDIWIALREQRLKLNEATLHISIIDTLFNHKILKLCVTDEAVHEIIVDTTNDIIQQSFARRSLLPHLASKFSELQLRNNELFSSSKFVFVSEILVHLFICSRINSNSFKLIEILCAKYDREINYCTTDVYFDIYGPKEITYKFKVISMISALKANSSVCLNLVEYIITNEQLHLFQPLKTVSGDEEATRIQLYSLLLLATKIINKDKLQFLFGNKIIKALKQEQSPKVRVYIEWLICLTCTEKSKEDFFNTIKDTNLQSDLNPSVLISYIRICYLLGSYKKLIPLLISYAASGKVLTRHFAASLICSLYELDLPLIKEEEDILKSIVDSLAQYSKANEFRVGDANLWNIQDDLTLTGIFGGVLYKLSNEVSYFTAQEFEQFLCSEELENIANIIDIGGDYKKVFFSNKETNKNKENLSRIEGNNGEVALQKKSGYWKNMVDKEEAQVKRSKLIVMGSLVNKPPNLGGICRLCDVLGAGLLTIGDEGYKKHPQFRSVAVTADKWLPILEVKPENIIEYLQKMKSEGYTLIGLEQTDKSVQLNYDLKFPEKSLIVLGKEKEGVPGDILAQLDFCVEIKQVGVIRSMNIQTATALIVHAYSLQYF